MTLPSSADKRPASNWAQIISALSSILTVLVAVYAIFFSNASQTLINYMKSEIESRNVRIVDLEAARHRLQADILLREREIQDLDVRSRDLRQTVAALEGNKDELANALEKLLEQKNNLEAVVDSLRSRSLRNEFAYVREKLAYGSGVVLVVTWPLNIIGGETSGRARRETLWPQYIEFYRQEARKLPANEIVIANQVLEKFEVKCARFRDIVFNIPDFRGLSSEVAAERARLISQRAFETSREIRNCLRSVEFE